MVEEKHFNPKALVQTVFDKALNAQQPLAAANVERLRRLNPDKSPTQLIAILNRYYLIAVTGTGAGAGAAALVPNGVVQVPVALADLATFLETSVLYTLSVAEVHRVDLEDVERRRLLVMAVLLGDSAATAVIDPLIKKSVPYWGKAIADAVPLSAIKAANKVLGPRFVTRYGAKQGVLVLGKQAPLALGVVIGAGGNHVFGRFTIKSAKTILGPAPTSWDSGTPDLRRL